MHTEQSLYSIDQHDRLSLSNRYQIGIKSVSATIGTINTIGNLTTTVHRLENLEMFKIYNALKLQTEQSAESNCEKFTNRKLSKVQKV